MKDKDYWLKHFGAGKTAQVYKTGMTEMIHSKSLSDAEKHAAMDALEELAPTAAGRPTQGWMRDMAASGAGGGAVKTKAFGRTGREVAPLAFDEESLSAMHQAVVTGQSLRIKAFSSPVSQMPPELYPVPIGPVHENRLLDRLPTEATTAPSVEYIRHLSTTGTPAVVAEGGLKPELVFNTQPMVATPQKIAAHTATTWEAVSDYSDWIGYTQGELFRQIIDVENGELLAGPGTANHMTGFLSTSGILTHTVAPNTTNTLDDVEQAIATMRTGPALAVANLLVLHPLTWSAMRRTKDSYGRYLVAPDPTKAEADSLWNVEILVTTEQAAGAGLLLDTGKFGRVLVREALSLRTITAGDDALYNLVRFVAEERLELAITRPAAVLSITGLPTS